MKYYLSILLIIVLITSCSKEPKFENPFDAETSLDPSQWSPYNFQVEPLSDSKIYLHWSEEETRIEGFEIERQLNNGSSSVIQLIGKDSLNYIDDSLNFSTLYTYRVRAFTPSNKSNYTIACSLHTIFPTPTNLNVIKISDHSISLNWEDNCNFELGYKIERKENESIFELIKTTISNVNEFIDDNINYESNYQYKLYAYTQYNISNYTVSDSVYLIIDPPTNLSMHYIDITEIKLIWNDNCSFEQSYTVERNENNNGFIPIHSTTSSVTEYIDSQLNYGSTYEYRVSANTIYNQSDFSNTVSYYVSLGFEIVYGGVGSDIGKCVQKTDDDGYILLGSTNSYGEGDYDFWLIKTDFAGNIIWSKTFGGSFSDYGNFVQQTEDGGYILVGQSYSDDWQGSAAIWLIKTNSIGEITWDIKLGDQLNDSGHMVQQTNDGGFVIAADNFILGNYDDFSIIKVDAIGCIEWEFTHNGNGLGSYDVAYSVYQTEDLGYICAGSHSPTNSSWERQGLLIKLNESGNEQWRRTYDVADAAYIYDVKQTSDGGYILTGNVGLIKTNYNGNNVWENSEIIGISVQETPNGDYVVFKSNFELVKTDCSGNIIWTKQFYGENGSCVNLIDGGYIMIGSNSIIGSGESDFYLIKTDENGEQ